MRYHWLSLIIISKNAFLKFDPKNLRPCGWHIWYSMVEIKISPLFCWGISNISKSRGSLFCGGLALFWFIAEYEAKKCLQSPHLQFFPMQLHLLSSIFCFVSIISRIFQSPASAWLQSAKWEKAESSRSSCVSPRAPRSPRPRFSSLKEALRHLEALDLVHLPAPRTLGVLDLVQPRQA